MAAASSGTLNSAPLVQSSQSAGAVCSWDGALDLLSFEQEHSCCPGLSLPLPVQGRGCILVCVPGVLCSWACGVGFAFWLGRLSLWSHHLRPLSCSLVQLCPRCSPLGSSVHSSWGSGVS